jgi:hypothetical protein
MSTATVVGVVVIVCLGVLYVTPSLVAARRSPAVLPRLLQLNVFLGWTGVVWLYCLWTALRRHGADPRSTASERAPLATSVVLQPDRLPNWVAELPVDHRVWAALPCDTAPLPTQYRPEDI